MGNKGLLWLVYPILVQRWVGVHGSIFCLSIKSEKKNNIIMMYIKICFSETNYEPNVKDPQL